MLNRDGVALLGALIDRMDALAPDVERGDCATIAAKLNGFMPPELQLSPADVYAAVADRPDFGGPRMNVEILRARIDANPVLYSARLNGDHQAIFNELNMDAELAGKITMADVDAAMRLRVVPRPERTVAGSAALVGIARIS